MFGKSKPKPKAKVEDDWYPISRDNGISPPNTKRKNVVDHPRSDHGQTATEVVDTPVTTDTTEITTTTKPTHNKNNYLVHRITGKETLLGLSLKYNVSVADLKRVNKFWTNDDLFAKHEVLIPVTATKWLEKQKPILIKYQQENENSQENIVQKFSEMTSCDNNTAEYFLEIADNVLYNAIEMYYNQSQEELEKTMEKLKNINLNKIRIIEPEENEKSDNYNPAIVINSSVQRVSLDLEKRFQRDEDALFNL